MLAVDGFVLRDVIDWSWFADGLRHELAVARGMEQATVVVDRSADEPWGVGFASAVFDRVRTCRNACAFCFMEQLPPGLRPSLSLKDDDYRLSFLDGNFITLTNFREEDVARIAEQGISPLHISLHAVTPEVRAALMCPHEDRALHWFDRLVEEGVDLHVQIVLVPGVNDGDELDRTLTWLAQRDGVVSVGIVPAGYTRFATREPAPFSRAHAGEVIAHVEEWRRAMRERDGISWVHLADEFYLTAGSEVPPADEYDGFPQFENGIGMVRSLLDEADGLAGSLRETAMRLRDSSRRARIVTGTLVAPVFERVIASAGGEGVIGVVPVTNRMFGGNVSVTGLLSGSDIVEAVLSSGDSESGFLVPDVVFNPDGLTLDDLTFRELVERTGMKLRVVSCDAAGLLAGLTELSADVKADPKG